jgi:hypothetical protein
MNFVGPLESRSSRLSTRETGEGDEVRRAGCVGDGDLEIEMRPDDSKIHSPNCRNPAPIFATMTRMSFPFETCSRSMSEILKCGYVNDFIKKLSEYRFAM